MNISNCSLKDECQFVKELKNKISNMQESYETDAEAKFYDYLGKYNSKKPLTANDYVELNKNNEIPMSYNQTLLKENQELKEKIKKLSQWDTNKDTRNSRQRVANAKLLKENQELKKQLENCYCNRTDCSGRIKDSKVYDSLVQKVETQQKEFIKYLEDEIKSYKNRDTYIVADIFGSYNLNDIELKLLEEILQKYKEIIGVSNDY